MAARSGNMPGSEEEIILCFECGAKNRLKEGWTGAPACGKCKEPLPVVARPVKTPADSKPTTNGSAASSAPRKPTSWWSIGAIVVFFFACLGGFQIWEEWQSNRRSQTEQSAAPPVQQPTGLEPATTTPSAPLDPADLEPLDLPTASQPVAVAPTAPLGSNEPEVKAGRTKLEIVTTATSWVQISRPTGVIIYSEIMEPGEAYLVPEEDGLLLTVGNSGGVRIAVNGKLGSALGPNGEVMRDIELAPYIPAAQEIAADDTPRQAAASPSVSPPPTVPVPAASALASSPPVSPPPIVPVPVKPGVIFIAHGRKAVAPFQIKTPAGANYYIKLVEILNGEEAAGIYAVGGTTIKVKVPLGRYEMRYAMGDIWQGRDKLFAPQTSYEKSTDVFDFVVDGDQVTGYTVELIQQVNGNMETHPIDAAQF